MRIPFAAASTALAVTFAVSSATAQTTPPQQDMDLARSIFSELIEINTVDSELGNNTTAARAMERRLLEAGFPEGGRACARAARRADEGQPRGTLPG